MRKGFTLIELLAVIVILAIIALIATPIVLNIIKDAKESAVLRSAEFYVDAVEQSIASSTMQNIKLEDGTYSIMQDGNICIGILEDNICNGDILKVNVKGEKPTGGSITIENGKITSVDLVLSDKTLISDSNGEFILTNGYTPLSEFRHIKGPQTVGSMGSYLIAPIKLSKNQILLVHAFSDDELDDVYSNFGVFQENTIIENVIFIGNIKFISSKYWKTCLFDEEWKPMDCHVAVSEIIENSTERLFFGCTNLKNVILSNSVTSIEGNAFYGCTSLTSISIPSSVTSIFSSAFSGCNNLTTIYYKGTSEDPVGDNWGAPNATVITDF